MESTVQRAGRRRAAASDSIANEDVPRPQPTEDAPRLGRRPRGPSDNIERALIAAARRKDRSNAGKITSAKQASASHFENQGRYLYLTEDVILNENSPFDDLMDPEQLMDPNLILPDEVTLELVLKQYGYPPVRLAPVPGHAYEATVAGQAIPAFPGTLSSLSSPSSQMQSQSSHQIQSSQSSLLMQSQSSQQMQSQSSLQMQLQSSHLMQSQPSQQMQLQSSHLMQSQPSQMQWLYSQQIANERNDLLNERNDLGTGSRMEFMNPFMGNMNGVPDLLATGLPDLSQALMPQQSIQPTFLDLQGPTYASPGSQQLFSDFRTTDLPSVFPERGAVNLEAFDPVVNSNETRSNNTESDEGDSQSLDENGEANEETSDSTKKKTDTSATQPANSETTNQQEMWDYGYSWDKEPSEFDQVNNLWSDEERT